MGSPMLPLNLNDSGGSGDANCTGKESDMDNDDEALIYNVIHDDISVSQADEIQEKALEKSSLEPPHISKLDGDSNSDNIVLKTLHDFGVRLETMEKKIQNYNGGIMIENIDTCIGPGCTGHGIESIESANPISELKRIQSRLERLHCWSYSPMRDSLSDRKITMQSHEEDDLDSQSETMNSKMNRSMPWYQEKKLSRMENSENVDWLGNSKDLSFRNGHSAQFSKSIRDDLTFSQTVDFENLLRGFKLRTENLKMSLKTRHRALVEKTSSSDTTVSPKKNVPGNSEILDENHAVFSSTIVKTSE